ncbi:MAG: pilus assembly protein PilM [Clostridiales bacterium]|nr:pilus assembly protein PilM [Clostridiales bacterium]
MAGKLLYIEVGDRLVKVMCAVPQKKGLRAIKSFMFQPPEGSVFDGVIQNPEELSEALVAQLLEHRLRGVKNVVFNLASGKVASREVKLPPVKEKLLAPMIATNAADYFPIDLSRYHISHTLLEKVKGEGGFCRVLALAAPLSLLEGYFKLGEFAGLKIKAIDSSANSHYRALRPLRQTGVTMYVDVECTESFASFIQDGRLLLQRTFALGGDEFIKSYMEKVEKPEEEYIEALSELSVSAKTTVMVGAEGQMTHHERTEELSRLVSNIARSVDYFNSSRWETATSQIVLTGPCGRLEGLKEMVAAETGLPTFYLEELEEVRSVFKTIEDPSAFLGCVGAAHSPVDLLPEHFMRASRGMRLSKNETSIASGLISFSLLFLGAVVLSIIAVSSNHEVKRELSAIRSEISEIEYTQQVALSYESYQQGETALLEMRALADSPNAKLAAFFEELEQKMPSKILILSAVCSAEGVTMNITVPSYAETAVVLDQLRTFESISKLEVLSVSQSTNEGGSETSTFSVSCLYGENPYLNGENPYADLIGESTDSEGQVD